MAKKSIPLIVIILLSILFGFSLLHSGLPPTHDGEYHVVRFYEFDKSLKEGEWYPRWAPDLNQGFGIPLFNYSYPLPNYVASFIHVLGFSFIDVFKLELYLSVLMSGIFFYLWTKRFFGKLGGLVCASFYMFSPYHIVDVYIRGSVGEAWALAFYPAVLWAITEYRYTKKPKYFFLSTFFFSLTIFSHNILALQFLPFVLSYGILLSFFDKDKLTFLKQFLTVFILGVGISSLFWMPALFEKPYVVGLQIYEVTHHFPDLYELLIPTWGSGFFTSEPENRMSVQIGIANLIAFFASILAFLVYVIKKDKTHSKALAFFIIWFMLFFFLMLSVSKPVWRIVPLMDYFQFPWRFLGISILCLSFLSGSLFGIFYKTNKSVFTNVVFSIVFLFFFSIPLLFSIGYIKMPYYLERDDRYYISRPNFIYGTNSIGNAFNTVWFDASLKRPERKIAIIKGKGYLKNEKVLASSYAINTDSAEALTIQINTAYFPGWEATIDGKTTQIAEKRGIMYIVVPSGSHTLFIHFQDTLIRKMSVLVTIASIVLLVALSLKGRYVRIKK